PWVSVAQKPVPNSPNRSPMGPSRVSVPPGNPGVGKRFHQGPAGRASAAGDRSHGPAYIGSMAQIAFFAPMGPGHVNPMLGLAAALVRRGHDVTFAAPE